MTQLDVPAPVGWLALVGLTAVFLALVAVGLWLFYQRRRDEMRQELAEELQTVVRRLGLGTVWQAQLFQADVYGIRGAVEHFEIRAELWDKSSRDFFRLAIYFPRPIARDFRLLSRRRGGLVHLLQLKETSIGDGHFESTFHLYYRPGDDEVLKQVFNRRLQNKLAALERGVDGIKIGSHSFYLHVDSSVPPKKIESLVSDTLEIATILYERAVNVGAPDNAYQTEYELASVDVLGRETVESDPVEDFPEGTTDLAAVDPEFDDGDRQDDQPDPQSDSGGSEGESEDEAVSVGDLDSSSESVEEEGSEVGSEPSVTPSGGSKGDEEDSGSETGEERS